MEDQQKEKKRGLLATSLASPFAGMIGKFVMHPVDTIKSKVQVNRMQIKLLSDYKPGMVLNLIKQTWKRQGIAGFFRGVTISVFGTAFAYAAYMSGYQHSKHYLIQHQFFKKYPSLAHLVAGFMAEIASCTLWLPIDIIKQRMQVQSQIKLYSYKSPVDAMKKIQRAQGLIGLYRAFGATLLFFGPFSAIFFAAFQKLKQLIVKDKQNQLLRESILCSAVAGAIAGFLTTPLQIVKLRMQIQRADVATTGGKLQNSVFGYRNSIHGLRLIVKNQGFLSLYKGAFLRVCFSMPITTITMTLTQYFKQIVLQKRELLDQYI